MKKIIFTLLAALSLVACTKDFIVYEDIPAIYSFCNSGLVQISATSGTMNISVSKGGYPDKVTSASIEVSSSLLIALNMTGSKQYDLMPPACYTIDNDTVSLDVDETSGSFVISFNEDVLKSLAKGNYALPLQLKSGENVKKGQDALYLAFQKL